MSAKNKVFIRGNGIKIEYDGMIQEIKNFISISPNSEYELTVGTDS